MAETPQREVELRSSEVQEIISQVPSPIIRWGMLTLFSVLSILILISWFIEYPDILQAKIIVTTSSPPSTLVSRNAGNLVILKKDKEEVKKGQMIAYLQSNAAPQFVLDIEKALIASNEDFEIVTSQNSLGELEQDYGVFLNAIQELKLFRKIGSQDIQIKHLEKQRNTFLRLQKSLLHQKQIAEQEFALATKKFKMDSVLFEQKVTATIDFNKDKSTWLQQQRSFNETETALINNELQLNQLSKQISDLTIQKTELQQKLEIAFLNSKNTLLAHIAKWKEIFIFTAPQDGRLAYIGFIQDGMFVESSQAIFSVLPLNGIIVVRAELPLYNSGKVKSGQRVKIRLDNYPFEQYGAIPGIVSSISSIPSEEKYFVNIALPQGLTTDHNKTLEFQQQLSGTTEIITEELRLMERFFYQFRKIIRP
jgi:multidrug resistance efflux pump